MNYYLIKPNTEKAGVPIFLSGVLSESFDAQNPFPPMDYDWCAKTSTGRESPLPSSLFLVVKHRQLKADYLPAFDGFIVSSEMLSCIQESATLPFDIAELTVIDRKGHSATEKSYFYIDYLYTNRVDNINAEKSLFAWNLALLKHDKINIETVNMREHDIYIKGFKELVLDETDMDIFLLADLSTSNYLFCNELFKQKVEAHKLYGIEFIQLPYLGDIYEHFYNYGEVLWNR